MFASPPLQPESFQFPILSLKGETGFGLSGILCIAIIDRGSFEKASMGKIDQNALIDQKRSILNLSGDPQNP